LPGAELDNAGISAHAILVTRGNVIEELFYGFRVTQASRCQAAGMDSFALTSLIASFCQRNQAFCLAAHRQRLGVCGADSLMLKQLRYQDTAQSGALILAAI
jgi:hypothetical protein